MSATLYEFTDEENAWLAISGFSNGEVFLTAQVGREHRVDVSIPFEEIRILQLALMRHVAQAKVALPSSGVAAESARPVAASHPGAHSLAGRALQILGRIR